MKTLYLLRHAKSSWADDSLPDHRRPLNKRGERDAPKMGKWLSEQSNPPEWALCSDANRTLATFTRINQYWKIPPERLQITPALYMAGSSDFWQMLHQQPASTNSLLMVSHNPGITEFANQLSPDFETDNMPTCAVAAFQFNTDNWQDIEKKGGHCLFYQYPKGLH